MQPQTDGDYQKLLTQVIKKQIIVLGPDITLAKARNVSGLTILDDGSVTEITGNPQELTQKLVEQFMELSGLIVKKTMEPLLAGFPGMAGIAPIQEVPISPQPILQSQASLPQAPIQPASQPLNEQMPASASASPPPAAQPIGEINVQNQPNEVNYGN